jgi:endonuclease YncB( thermonuclease family)
MVARPYVYPVTEVVKVSDGDTYWFRVDVGFRENLLINCRLNGYDCPEKRSGSYYEKQQAIVATKVATDFLEEGVRLSDLWVETLPDPDDFGRWLGTVWRESETVVATTLGNLLRRAGLASLWPQRWHEEFDPNAEI